MENSDTVRGEWTPGQECSLGATSHLRCAELHGGMLSYGLADLRGQRIAPAMSRLLAAVQAQADATLDADDDDDGDELFDLD